MEGGRQRTGQGRHERHGVLPLQRIGYGLPGDSRGPYPAGGLPVRDGKGDEAGAHGGTHDEARPESCAYQGHEGRIHGTGKGGERHHLGHKDPGTARCHRRQRGPGREHGEYPGRWKLHPQRRFTGDERGGRVPDSLLLRLYGEL